MNYAIFIISIFLHLIIRILSIVNRKFVVDTKKISSITDISLKTLIKAPFIFYKNKNYFIDIFNDYINNSLNERKKILLNFNIYFFKTWILYFDNGMLNYFNQ